MSSRRKTLRASTLLALSLLLVPLRASDARQESDAAKWINVSPSDEGFSVVLPTQPAASEQQLRARSVTLSGRLYTATGRDSVAYFIWSLKSPQDVIGQFTAPSDYLDACAELAWDLIIKPEMDRAKHNLLHKLLFKPELEYGMSYVREASVDNLMREYRIKLNGRRGAAHIFTRGSQTYIVAAYGTGASDANVATFLKSFAVKKPEGIGTGTGGGVGPGLDPGRVHNIGGGEHREYPSAGTGHGEPGTPCGSEYDRAFSVRQVTRRAKVHAKPEPVYTEWARKFSVTGTVRLFGLLNRDGTVTNIVALTHLPHGLTRRAIEAMRQIKFESAEKDGCKVSQYVKIDYNFNIY
jgi:hypothetical protein